MSTSPKPSHETIFADALAQPAGEREAFVDRACADDLAMAAQVKELLRGYEENSGFLEAPPAVGAVSPVGPVPSPGEETPGGGTRPTEDGARPAGHNGHLREPVPGDRIGSYRLLERIGEGACGIVYMAEQEQPVRRRVALKLIKLGLDTRDFIARFEAERQALALMDHPNIARVFDAGATDKGRPYLVMELVRGIPITKYCDDNHLPPLARLELFITVCHAIQHAHQKGIIHRDIKPSNILVAVNDGEAVPKVIDFGIAKATQGRLTDKTLFTRFHAFIGTPAYSSPEQAEVTNLDVDTRSDIYSLGVLLYELLTGHQPVDHATIERLGFEELRRLIREVEPPRPSARVSSLGLEERTSVAQRRAVDTGKLALLLRSDLDWIVMRCLEKDRRRRYESASALAQDVGRYLDNEPIVARPPSAAYRLQKLIRRHKPAFVAATGILAALVVGLIVSSVLFLRERVARSRAVVAEKAESSLRREAETARELETRRAARTALDLADKLLEEGKTAEALAYFVHAARKDPGNTIIAPRLASVLTSRNFLIPDGVPFECGSRALAMRFTKDGRSLYVGTEDGTFRIFDAASGALTREFRLGKNVRRGGLAFARDTDAIFAVRFFDNTIAPFDVASGQPLWPPIHADIELPSDVGLGGGAAVGLSPDGRWCYVNGITDFWLFDTATGESRMKLHFTEWHFPPDFTPDGTRLVLSWGDKIRVWSLPECALALEPIAIERRTNPGMYLLPYFSPDARRLAVCDPFAGIHFFDAANGARQGFVARPHGFDASSAGYLPDGRMFVADDRAAALLNLDTKEATTLPIQCGFAAQAQRLATADGRLLLTTSTDGFTRLWNTANGQLVAEPALHQEDKYCIALSPDGGQVVIGTGSGKIHWLRVGRGVARPLVLRRTPPVNWLSLLPTAPARMMWFREDHARAIDLASGRETYGGFRYPPSETLSRAKEPNLWLNFRPDFKFLLVRDASGENPSRAWEILTDGSSRAIPLQSDTGSPPGPIGVAFSRVGDLVARSKLGGRLIGVWDLSTGAAVGPGCSFENREICLYPGIDFSPDGKRLAGGIYGSSTVVIWEAATGRLLTVIDMRADAAAMKVLYSPDGTRLLTLNERHEARLWDAFTGKPRSPILRSTDASDALFSPDGRWFATWGDHTVSIWDGKTGSPISKPSTSGGGSLKFSPDGTRVVTFDGHGIARVWDVRTGQPLTEPMRHDGTYLNLEAFSPDERFVQTPLVDGRSFVWSVPLPLPDGAPIPEWLLQLASICAAKTVDEAGQCVDAPELVAPIDEVRHQLAALPDDAPLVAWGRWFLDDSPTRSIAPGFTITPAEAEKLAESPAP